MKRKENLGYLHSRGKLTIVYSYRKSKYQYMITDKGIVYNRITREPLETRIGKDGKERVLLENKDGSTSAIAIKSLQRYSFSNKNIRKG